MGTNNMEVLDQKYNVREAVSEEDTFINVYWMVSREQRLIYQYGMTPWDLNKNRYHKKE